MAPAIRQFIQEEHAIMSQRHLPRPRHLAASDQPHIGDRVMRRSTRTRGHDGRARASAASDAMDARGVEGIGQRHVAQEGRETSRQRQRASSCRPQYEQMMPECPHAPLVGKDTSGKHRGGILRARTWPFVRLMASATPAD
jgi:hypothetical protein